jgi:hypothetical protein
MLQVGAKGIEEEAYITQCRVFCEKFSVFIWSRISLFLCKPKVLHSVALLDSILSQFNPIHKTTPYFPLIQYYPSIYV